MRRVGKTVSLSGPSITISRPVASFTAAIMAGLYWSMFSRVGAATPASASRAKNATTAAPIRIQVRFCMAMSRERPGPVNAARRRRMHRSLFEVPLWGYSKVVPRSGTPHEHRGFL